MGAVLAYNIMRKMVVRESKMESTTNDNFEMNVEDDSTQESLAYSELMRELEDSLGALPEKCKLVFKMSRIDEKKSQRNFRRTEHFYKCYKKAN